MAWLSFVDSTKHLQDGSLARLLDDVLMSFTQAGLAGQPDLCHYCRREKVEALTCHRGRVAQICPSCLIERTDAPSNRPAEATEGALAIAVLGPVATVIGAMCWGGVWSGYDLLFDLLKTNVVYVPRLLEVVALFCIAAVVGGPVGFVIKRVPRRGKNLAVTSAIVCTVAAIVLGEVFYVSWLIYRELKVFSFSAAWDILPRLEMEMETFHLAIKLMAAIGSVIMAVLIAKPPKPKLNL